MTDQPASEASADGGPRRRKHVPWKGRPGAPVAPGAGAADDGAGVDSAEAAQVAAVRAQNRASDDQAMRERGRKIGGVGGAALAGMMVAMRDIYERAPQDQGAVVVDSPSEPLDAHRDGMKFGADDVDGDADVAIDAQDRRDPVVPGRRQRRILPRFLRR